MANLVKSLTIIDYYNEGWQAELFQKLIQLYWVTQGYSILDELPALLQADLKNLVGFTQSQEELKTAVSVQDT